MRARVDRPARASGPGLGRGRLLLIPLLVWALWRTTLGVDLNDGPVAVAIPMRLARGDVLFADEMAPQALGALPAVPFTWLWLALVGTEGIVLASRVFFVLVSAGIGWLCYRAWRLAEVAAWPALGAAVIPLIPMAYNLPVLGYNTVPGLAGLLALATASAAVQRGLPGPALLAGASAVVMGAAHPAGIPAATLLVLVAVSMTDVARVRRAFALGLLIPTVVALAWVVFVPGWAALWESIEYGSQVQESRPRFLEQAGVTLGWYTTNIPVWVWLPALLVSGFAALLGRRWAWVRPLVLTAPLVVAVGLLGGEGARTLPSGSAGLVLLVLLLLPALSWAQARDAVRTTLWIGLPAGLLGGLALTVSTASGPAWGAGVTGAAPALAAVTMATIAGLARVGLPVAIGSVVLLTTVLAGAHTATIYRNGGPGDLTDRVADGPNAGLLTTACYAEADALVAARMPQGTKTGVLVHGMAGAYAHAQGPMDATRLWMADFGEANRVVVDWIERTDRRPGVVLVAVSEVRAADGLERLAASDALIGWVVAGYGEPIDAGPFLAFVDPTRPDAEALREHLTRTPPAVTEDADARARALAYRC